MKGKTIIVGAAILSSLALFGCAEDIDTTLTDDQSATTNDSTMAQTTENSTSMMSTQDAMNSSMMTSDTQFPLMDGTEEPSGALSLNPAVVVSDSMQLTTTPGGANKY